MKNKMRKELRIGLLINAMFLVLNQFVDFPELLLGVLCGLGLCFMLIGALPEKAYAALKDRKKSLFTSK